MNKVRNTTAEVKDGTTNALEIALPGGIVEMEARGQRELVESDVLPSDIEEVDRKALEAAGVVFGEKVDGDPLFTKVTFPKGWTKRATGHSMWNELLDDRGRVRARIFYKAAFYDRKAHIDVTTRFQSDIEIDHERHRLRGQAKDGNKVLFSSEWLPEEREVGQKVGNFTLSRNVAIEWLNTNHPQWKDLTAYWDAP
jgi:hypothetical protein